MKNVKLIVLTVAVFTSFFNQAQDLSKLNQWSIGLQVGGHDGIAPVKTGVKFFTHVNGDVRYMVNNRFGIMGDIGYESFAWKTDESNNTQLMRFSLQGVVNVGDILRFDTWTKRFGLLVHGGAGYSKMWQKDLFSYGEGDAMGNFILGITPQFMISDRIAVNLDWSGILNAGQSRTFDFKSKLTSNGVDAAYMTASAGVTIYLGKNERHADWIPSEFGGGKDVSLERRVAELEAQAKDDDGDGVPNMYDKEANTPKGSAVNSKGEAVVAPIDSDNDGVVDEFDMCPNTKGLFSANGCPDSDKDGVIDSEDKCPNVAGLVSESGCPAVDEETKKVFDEALHGINFETGKDVIKPSSYSVLNKVVSVMEKHPEFNLDISGHTDNTGDAQKNLELSKKRAQAVTEYLKGKGIDTNRMESEGFGQSKPTSSNDTKEGRADNRRVEFNIIFE
jgi:outer membrane protein OmpA-like peptidoglycan-associated protein